MKYFFKLRLKLGEPQSVHSSGRFGALLRPVPECIFVSKMDLMQSLDMNSLKNVYKVGLNPSRSVPVAVSEQFQSEFRFIVDTRSV